MIPRVPTQSEPCLTHKYLQTRHAGKQGKHENGLGRTICIHCARLRALQRCRDPNALSGEGPCCSLASGTGRCSCTADAAATPARGLSCSSVSRGFCTRFTARAELHAAVVAALPPPVAELAVEMAIACSNTPLASSAPCHSPRTLPWPLSWERFSSRSSSFLLAQARCPRFTFLL